ncbi:hypothetical protein EDC04DRAFT_2901194 [Pisolithus marmoratus]|nr:hypothetical protein EDC04DRAFT_2901194 [Pisolithus marmoratus]
MGESSGHHVPRVYLCLMVVSNNKNLNTGTLFLAKFLNGTTPTFDHASDNCLNLTEDAAVAQTSAYPSRIRSLGHPTGETEKAEEDDKEDTNVVPEESKPVTSYRHRRPVSSTRDALISNTMRRARWLSPWFYEEKVSLSTLLTSNTTRRQLDFILSNQIGSFFNPSGDFM